MSSDLASNWNRLRDIDLGNGDGKKLKFGGRYSIDNLGMIFTFDLLIFMVAQLLHN